MTELEIALPAVSPRTGKLRTLLVPATAVFAMILSLGGLFGLMVTNQNAISRNCHTNLKTYQTLSKIIDHVESPPVLAGQPITPEQHAALHAYADYLREGLPKPAPTC